MNQVKEHISRLMMERNRLIVPGLGVFYASMAGAGFDNGVLLPPSRVIGFDYDEVVKDDKNVLYNSMSRCSCQEAMASGVASIIAELQNEGRSTISPFGEILFDTRNDELKFETAQNGWMPQLRLRPMLEEAAAQQDNVRDVQANTDTPKGLFWASSTAAALVIAAFITFFVNFFAQQDHSTATMATLAPAPRLECIVSAPSFPLQVIFNTPEDASCEVVLPVSKLEARPGDYCLVVASLASQAEAEQFIAEKSSDQSRLGILLKDGRFRVIAATGSSFAECQQNGYDNGATARFSSYWICKN